MKNKYKVGEIAEILGVSKDTLRIYDKKGILKPDKSQENNYRYYTCSDLICLDYIMQLRKMDMSLNKIGKLINNSNLEMEKQEKIIQDKIDNLAGLLESVKEYRLDLKKIESKLNRFTVEYSPQIIAMDLDDVSQVSIKKFAELVGAKMPYFAFFYDNIAPLKLGYSELLLDENERLKIYKHKRILIDYDNKYRLEDIKCKGIDTIPSKKCINVIVKSAANKDYSCIDMIGAYCLKNNIHPVGDSIVRVITVRRVYNQGNDYYEVWIPIE